MGKCVAITVRMGRNIVPLLEGGNCETTGTIQYYIDKLIKWIKKRKVPWFLSIEMAGTPAQHVHILLDEEILPKRITPLVKKVLNIEPRTSQWYKAVCCKEGKDPIHWLGYCAKEGNPENWFGTFTNEEIAEGIKEYRENEVVKTDHMNMDNYLVMMEEFMAEKGKNIKEHRFHEIMRSMELSGRFRMHGFLINKCKYSPAEIFRVHHGNDDDKAFEYRQMSLDCPKLTQMEVQLLRKVNILRARARDPIPSEGLEWEAEQFQYGDDE